MPLGEVLNVIIEGRGDATTRHPWSYVQPLVEGGRRRGVECDNGRKRRRHNQQPLVDPASSLVSPHTAPLAHD